MVGEGAAKCAVCKLCSEASSGVSPFQRSLPNRYIMCWRHLNPEVLVAKERRDYLGLQACLCLHSWVQSLLLPQGCSVFSAVGKGSRDSRATLVFLFIFLSFCSYVFVFYISSHHSLSFLVSCLTRQYFCVYYTIIVGFFNRDVSCLLYLDFCIWEFP